MTDDDKKLLTEFLGECWHENQNEHTLLASQRFCEKCGENRPKPWHLDFNDWRVVGRLIEKVGRENTLCVSVTITQEWTAFFEWADDEKLKADHIGTTPQEAICKAVLAWLKEQGND